MNVMKIFEDITRTVGNTPVVRLNRIPPKGAVVWGKLEFFNPCSNIKDRVGIAMIEAAEQQGILGPESTLLEATSGNTGIGLAFACAAKGYRLTIVMPEDMSDERKQLLRALGATLVLTPKEEGIPGAVRHSEAMAREDGRYVLTRQFENPANPAIHEKTTAREIWEDTKGKVDMVVAGIGTGGTLTGIARYLRKKNPEIIIAAVEPAASAVLSGKPRGPHRIQGIGAGFVPGVFEKKLMDEVVPVSDEAAIQMARRLAREEGIFTGISSGAALYAALKLLENPDYSSKKTLVVFPDSGDRYLSTGIFQMSAGASS
jgi:cysteine synthase A